MTNEPIELKHDVIALLIPGGEQFTLRAGAPVVVSQSFGTTFTVVTEDGYLARIRGEDADALGLEVKSAAAEDSSLPLEKRVWKELKSVYDPEIPVDVVELGLIYDVRLEEAQPGRSKVLVKMSMTAPGCGMGDVLKLEVEDKLRGLEGVAAVEVELVLEPPWDPSRMTEAARLATGITW